MGALLLSSLGEGGVGGFLILGYQKSSPALDLATQGSLAVTLAVFIAVKVLVLLLCMNL